MWAQVFGFFSNNKIVDKMASGIDLAIFTDEEKKNWFLKYLQASKNQSPARRAIALIVTVMWSLLVVLAVCLQLVGFNEKSEFVFNTLSSIVNQPFMIVMGFYFLAHVVRGGKS